MTLVIDLGAKYARTHQLLPLVDYIPVRPNLDQYDNTYHQNNEQQYELDRIEQPRLKPLQKHPLTGVTQFLDAFLQEKYLRLHFGNLHFDIRSGCYQSIHILVNDVHYYLQDLDFNIVGTNVFLQVSGIDFYPIPGKYNLPGREGCYTINEKQQIMMNCRSSGRVYQHQNVYLKD